MGLLSIPQMIHEWYGAVVEWYWQENRRTRRETRASAFIHHKSHWTDLGTNPGCHSEKPVNDSLSYGDIASYGTQPKKL
jgi:hypothetical protein